MIIPAQKFFRVVPNVTFRYRFLYGTGTIAANAPINLISYTAQLTLTSLDGQTSYGIYSSGVPSGQSGVFFGGDNSDPANGLIDLVIVAADTANFLWSTALYTFALGTPVGEVILPLVGAFNMVPLSVPSFATGTSTINSSALADGALGVLEL